jgi:hypothetical protein
MLHLFFQAATEVLTLIGREHPLAALLSRKDHRQSKLGSLNGDGTRDGAADLTRPDLHIHGHEFAFDGVIRANSHVTYPSKCRAEFGSDGTG